MAKKSMIKKGNIEDFLRVLDHLEDKGAGGAERNVGSAEKQMVAKKRLGDGYHLVAAATEEPYRLWFGFFKAAMRDQEVLEQGQKRVLEDRTRRLPTPPFEAGINERRQWGPHPAWWMEFYRSWLPNDPDWNPNPQWAELAPKGMEHPRWSDFHKIQFDLWFAAQWRDLFSVSFPIEELETDETVANGFDDKRYLTLKIPRTGNKALAIEQVVQIIQQTEWMDYEYFGESPDGYRLPVSDWISRMAKFNLTKNHDHGVMKRLPQVRRYLRLYECWLDHSDAKKHDRFNLAVDDFFAWYNLPKNKAEESIGKLPNAYFSYYEDFLKKRAKNKKLSLEIVVKNLPSGNVSMAKDWKEIIRADLYKARKIGKNILNEEFPGKYDNV